MIVAVFSYRFDTALLPALIANITPMVHGFVSYDDRRSDAALSEEPGRRRHGRLHGHGPRAHKQVQRAVAVVVAECERAGG